MSQVEKKLRKLRIERRPYPRLPRGSRGVAGREGCPGLSGALAHRVTPESIRGRSLSLADLIFVILFSTNILFGLNVPKHESA